MISFLGKARNDIRKINEFEFPNVNIFYFAVNNFTCLPDYYLNLIFLILYKISFYIHFFNNCAKSAD